MELRQALTEYVNAAFAGIWIQTQEPDEAVKLLYQLSQEQGWQYDQWDCARGTHSGGQPGDPLLPLKTLRQKDNKRAEGPNELQTSLMVLWNYHKFLTNVMVMQELQLAVIEGKLTRKFVVILSPVVN